MRTRSVSFAVPFLVLGLQPPHTHAQLGIDGRPLSERIGDGSKGVRLFPRPTESLSGTAEAVPPTIDPNTGWVYSGSSSGSGRGSLVPNARTNLVKVANGGWRWEVAYWPQQYGRPPANVPASDRIQRLKADEERRAAERELERTTEAMNFRIDGQGRAYAGNDYLGQARRVVNKQTGRNAWRYDIPNGWTLILNDGATKPERHQYAAGASLAGSGRSAPSSYSVTFTNDAPYGVDFILNGNGTPSQQLRVEPGRSATFNLGVAANFSPLIAIRQPDGSFQNFSLPLRDQRYRLRRTPNNRVENVFE